MPEKNLTSNDVTVVIPAYHAADSIGAALESIASQTVKPFEVIVVDDGSNDDTFKIANTFHNKLAPIQLRVIQQTNQGAAIARNQAIFGAKGRVLAFLDADDTWMPEKLAASLAVMNDTNAVLVAHDFQKTDIDGQSLIIECAARFNAELAPYRTLYRKGIIGCSTVLARTDAVRDVGGMDPKMLTAQDFDLWLKILADPNAHFHIFAGVHTRYLASDTGITSNTERRLACTMKIAKRHQEAVRQHGGGQTDYLYRILAVHGEAMRTYKRRGEWGHVFNTGIRAGWQILRAAVSF